MTDTQPATAVQAGFPCVAGRCPSCQGSSLFLAEGGHVTCSRLDCPNPARADDLLHGGPPEHVADTARRREWAAAWRAAASLLATTELPASTRTAHIVTEVAQEFVAELQDRAEEVEAGTRTPWADLPEPAAAESCGTWVPELGPCIEERPCSVHEHPPTPPAQPSTAAPAAAGPGQWTVLETDSQGERVEPSGQVWETLAEARAHAAEMDADHAARGEGGRYRVYRLVEVQLSGAAPAAEREHVVANAVAFEVYGADGRPSSPAGDTLAIRVTDEERATAYRAARRVLAHLAEFDAEHHGDSPPAAGPHPDTPDRAGVLGRALLHQTVDGHPQLWAERDGLWHTHIASGPRTRVYIESAERYVGPVLLVSPAAGRVLDAARHVAALDSLGDYQDWRRVAALYHNLRDAVDALDGDQPARTAPKRSRARLVADPIHTCVTPRGRREECAGCSAEAAELAIESDTPMPETEAEIDAGMAEFAALPDCDYCGGTGKQVPPGWYERRRDAERRAAEIIQPAVDALTPEQFDALVAASRPEAAPELDSGPGCREALCRDVEADRDRLERELAEVTASRNRWHGHALDLRAELATARRDAADWALALASDQLMDSQGFGIVVDIVCKLREEVRAGTRPAPGSPQPAGEGGGDDG